MTRKYRQAGYQDSDKGRGRDRQGSGARPPRQELSFEERIQKRSMRHAIDREAHQILRCHNCGQSAQGAGPVLPETVCPHCATPLHCCRTCTYFDSAARWQCRAEIAAVVGDKNKANDCTKYAARLVLDVTGRRTRRDQGASDAKSQFDNLFKS